MKKLLFIFNPWSGKARVKDHLFEISDEFTKAGYLVTTYPTQRMLDCYNFIKSNGNNYDIIVSSGGDGTLNETVAGVLDGNCDNVLLGYIPTGSTNDFATSLLIPKTVSRAVQNIIHGTEYKCDVGSFNGRWFNYVAAFGAFTDVSYATPQTLKNALGHQAYVIESLKSFSNLKPYKIKVRTKDLEIEDTFLYGMVSNSKSVGGMKFLSGKNVVLNDGYFEVVLVGSPKNPLEFQELVNGLLFQEHNSIVRHIKCDEISFYSEENVSWVLDGEFGGEQKEVNITVKQNKVKYLLEKHP